MEIKDIFLTPIYLIFIYILAYWLRPKVTTKQTRKYFIPALTVKLLGAISLGVIYQFYYSGGDTFNYFRESKILYEAYQESFTTWLQIMLSNGEHNPETFSYSSRLYWYRAPNNFFIVKLTSFFGLLCFNTYTVIAIFFASFSFTGIYALYSALIKTYPKFYQEFAIAVFFVPSVFFWGSGLMKDTITLGALGWCFWAFYSIFIEKKKIHQAIVILLLAIAIIQIVKLYIIICFIPAAGFWIFSENSKRIKNAALRFIAKPFLIAIGVTGGILGGYKLTEDSEKYSVENIAETAAITSNYLERRTVEAAGTGRRTGSEYYIGNLDGSASSMISAAPQAIIVALFRPFIFEVKNPVMLLSAIESLWIIYLTITGIFRTGLLNYFRIIKNSALLSFCMVFTLMFAIGVGLTSGNFGTLVRYKIPLIPFFVSTLLIIYNIKTKKTKPTTGINSAKTQASLYQV